jgi:hypothetical protein
MEHKIAAYRHHIARMHMVLLTAYKKQKEWATIQLIAQNNNSPQTLIQRLNHQIQQKHTDKDHTNSEQQVRKIWAKFTYHSPLIRKITNILKHTNVRVAFRNTNTLQQLIKTKICHKTQDHERSGIHILTCNACKLSYIGQTSSSLQQRYKEHARFIKQNDPNYHTHYTF